VGILATACGSGPPFIDQMQPQAIDMAVRRGQFEMNCPTATGELINRETIQPAIQTVVYTGPTRAEYTVGVAGCGRRTMYIVIRPDNGSNNCFAGASRTVVQ